MTNCTAGHPYGYHVVTMACAVTVTDETVNDRIACLDMPAYLLPFSQTYSRAEQALQLERQQLLQLP
jgi:hypothetical protein